LPALRLPALRLPPPCACKERGTLVEAVHLGNLTRVEAVAGAQSSEVWSGAEEHSHHVQAAVACGGVNGTPALDLVQRV
jgi:hypothetical protein